MKGLCVVGLQAHDAKSKHEESRGDALAASEQLNESTANDDKRTDCNAQSGME